MPIVGGKFITSGSGDQFVATPFPPDVVMLLYNNNTVEHTWEALGGCLGMGWINRNNPGVDTNPGSFGSGEVWSGNQASSSWLFDVAIWSRTSAGSGAALFAIQMDDNGFTLRYSGGFAGGAGRPIYWMAIGDESLNIAKTYFTTGAAPESFECGFEPSVAFVAGSGGTSGGYGSVTFADYSVPTWGIASFGEELWSQNIFHGLQQSSSLNWFLQIGDRAGLGKAHIAAVDAIKVGGGVDLSTLFTLVPDGTALTQHTEGPVFGFPADNGRIGLVIADKFLAYNDIVPTPVGVGDELIYETPIDIEAIVFFCNSPNEQQTPTIPDFYGGSAFGYVTKRGDMAVTAAGGSRLVTSARFQSDQYAWVSNFTDPFGTAHYGIAEIIGNSFKLTTSVADNYPAEIGYMALGFESEAPGFFRVVYR